MPERPEFERVVTVLTFYFFSCGWCRKPRPPATHKPTSSSSTLWREEIAIGPNYNCASPGTPKKPESRGETPNSERKSVAVVSVIRGGETGWMRLPPPDVGRVRELNRWINEGRGVGGVGGKVVELEVENMVEGVGPAVRGGKRFQKGVLEDLERPVTASSVVREPGRRRGRSVSGMEIQMPVRAVTAPVRAETR